MRRLTKAPYRNMNNLFLFSYFIILIHLSLLRSSSASLPLVGISSLLFQTTSFRYNRNSAHKQQDLDTIQLHPTTRLLPSKRLSLSQGKPSFVLCAINENSQTIKNNGKQNATKSTNRKEPSNDTPLRNAKKRASQQDLHKLVKTMGLQPVARSGPDVGSKEKTGSTPSTPSILTPPIGMQLQYARKGHAVFRNLLPSQTLLRIKGDLIKYANLQELEAWQQKVEVALSLSKVDVQRHYTTIDACRDILQEYSMDGIFQIPFLQHFNTWRSIPSVKNLLMATSPLVHYAKVLMDVSHVKLYQDSLFHKRKNDGPTPWHSDARMAPFDTSKMITFWIPLDNVPRAEEGGTGLLFVNGSHSDFALPFWNIDREGGEYERLEERYGGAKGIEHYMPMSVGDVSAHAGWTLHSANGGMGHRGTDRFALAVSYVDANAEIRKDAVSSIMGHDEDRRSYEDWVREVPSRTYFEHPLVPTL